MVRFTGLLFTIISITSFWSCKLDSDFDQSPLAGLSQQSRRIEALFGYTPSPEYLEIKGFTMGGAAYVALIHRQQGRETVLIILDQNLEIMAKLEGQDLSWDPDGTGPTPSRTFTGAWNWNITGSKNPSTYPGGFAISLSSSDPNQSFYLLPGLNFRVYVGHDGPNLWPISPGFDAFVKAGVTGQQIYTKLILDPQNDPDPSPIYLSTLLPGTTAQGSTIPQPWYYGMGTTYSTVPEGYQENISIIEGFKLQGKEAVGLVTFAYSMEAEGQGYNPKPLIILGSVTPEFPSSSDIVSILNWSEPIALNLPSPTYKVESTPTRNIYYRIRANNHGIIVPGPDSTDLFFDFDGNLLTELSVRPQDYQGSTEEGYRHRTYLNGHDFWFYLNTASMTIQTMAPWWLP